MNEPFILVVIVGIAAIALFAIFYNKKAVIKRKLKNAELKRLNEFRDGNVARVVGKVEYTDEPLIAPLSGRECAYYYVIVEQEKSSGNSSSWHTLIEEEVAGDFVIRDDSNYALINSCKIKSYIVQDRNYKSGFLNDASLKLEKYLNSKGHESENMLGLNKTLRYKEGILEKGERIAVYGKGVWQSATALGLHEKYGRVLTISSNDDEKVYLSDDPDTTHATTEKTNMKRTSNTYGGAQSRYFEKANDERFYKK